MDYKKLLTTMDLSAVSLEPADNDLRYYCTPVDAEVFACAGVDGIHYCTIPAYGEMVFCVDPSGCHSPEVFPIAESMEALIRIILACGDMTVFSDMDIFCDETEFLTNVEACLTEEDVQSVLALLREKTGLEPAQNVYESLLLLQKGLDYSHIRYSEEYWEIHGEADARPDRWEVCFHGSFWGHDGSAVPGEEITLNKEFDWAGKHWRAPSLYLCPEGLVLDLCMGVERSEMIAFIEKWNAICEENDLREPSEQQMQTENPMNLGFSPVPTINGIRCDAYSSCSIPWTPSLPEEEREDSHEAAMAAAHYGLDPELCWMIHRFSFPWEDGKMPPAPEELSLTMSAHPVQIPACAFECHEPGGMMEVQHPVTGVLHTLTVTDCRPVELNTNPPEGQWECPDRCYLLSCVMEPEAEGWQVRCLYESDAPRSPFRYFPEADNSASVGIIGGADGPSALFVSPRQDSETPAVRCFPSSLHFELPEEMFWQLEWIPVRRLKKPSNC